MAVQLLFCFAYQFLCQGVDFILLLGIRERLRNLVIHVRPEHLQIRPRYDWKVARDATNRQPRSIAYNMQTAVQNWTSIVGITFLKTNDAITIDS